MKVRIDRNRLEKGVVLCFKDVEFSKTGLDTYLIFNKKGKKSFEFLSYQVARRFLTELLKGE